MYGELQVSSACDAAGEEHADEGGTGGDESSVAERVTSHWDSPFRVGVLDRRNSMGQRTDRQPSRQDGAGPAGTGEVLAYWVSYSSW